jgi:hypothetical protein
MRRSSADDRDEYAPGQFTDEEDDNTTPQDRRSDQRMWYIQRWGDLEEHISDEITREGFVTGGYVVVYVGIITPLLAVPMALYCIAAGARGRCLHLRLRDRSSMR